MERYEEVIALIREDLADSTERGPGSLSWNLEQARELVEKVLDERFPKCSVCTNRCPRQTPLDDGQKAVCGECSKSTAVSNLLSMVQCKDCGAMIDWTGSDGKVACLCGYSWSPDGEADSCNHKPEDPIGNKGPVHTPMALDGDEDTTMAEPSGPNVSPPEPRPKAEYRPKAPAATGRHQPVFANDPGQCKHYWNEVIRGHNRRCSLCRFWAQKVIWECRYCKVKSCIRCRKENGWMGKNGEGLREGPRKPKAGSPGRQDGHGAQKPSRGTTASSA
ncbi:hypothetical protein S7711_11429 [Stachybotrys chartarum IBT 7711]|uniref:Uncharacterized protein n=1 Tax=Stachybotrys chartarum (strain CBS 109288 / IBT 7711) TaxID=1280523 RepID=A0A084AH20_STACB|nr:hypothetical protein S7711_11429 [Stachybotrys chartarum IBT 7711]KFA47451.1 hypothetical protein S40293_10934 [Stachybotrys chartarum IBT 40293]